MQCVDYRFLGRQRLNGTLNALLFRKSGISDLDTINKVISADQSWKKSSGHAFEEMVKDEPSCFVIIDNRDNMRTVAIQKRKKAFGNPGQVAKILTDVIFRNLNKEYCYSFEILPEYYPEDLYKDLSDNYRQQYEVAEFLMQKLCIYS